MKEQFTVEFNGVTYPCFFVQTKEKAELILEKLKAKSGILAADTETMALLKHVGNPEAALSPHLGEPRLIQFFTGTGAVVIDLKATGKIDLKGLLEKRSSVFHNMAFDYKMLRQHYNVVDVDMHCTMIMARCVFHTIFAEDVRANLETVVNVLFKEQTNKTAGKSDWSKPLTFEQIHYAAKDAILQMRVYEKLNDYIDKLGLRKVYDLYRKAQLVICEMELNGICFDDMKHRVNVVRWREELKDAEEEVLKMTGISRITDGELATWLEGNLPSKLLDIWPHTETGKLSTSADTFIDFSHLDIVKPFSKYQKLKKLTTSFGMNLLHMINPETKKIHCGYHVAGAKTGRLSCSNPNIQQSPRSPEFRSAFIPSPGYEMVVADYSQVEVRCIAEMSNDEKMLEAYQSGLDIYSFTASQLTGKSYEAIGKKSKERQQAKALVLGLNYGLGAKKFSHYAKKGYDVEMDHEESNQLVRAYRKLYPDLRKWQLRQVDECIARKYTVVSVMGKRRKLTDENFYGACMNHPIQAQCAEIMLLALIKAKEYLRNTSARLLACVHDEIVLECLSEDVSKVKSLIAQSMVDGYSEIIPNARTLKNLVEPSSGMNWGEAKS